MPPGLLQQIKRLTLLNQPDMTAIILDHLPQGLRHKPPVVIHEPVVQLVELLFEFVRVFELLLRDARVDALHLLEVGWDWEFGQGLQDDLVEAFGVEEFRFGVLCVVVVDQFVEGAQEGCGVDVLEFYALHWVIIIHMRGKGGMGGWFGSNQPRIVYLKSSRCNQC
jgi:hypothetical protein